MRRRRGITIFESIIACGLMGVAVTLAAELTLAVAAHQRACLQHSVARQEAANALEMALASPREEASIDLSKEARRLLRGGAVKVQRHSAEVEGTNASAERVVVTVAWISRDDGARRFVRLIGWRFAGQEATP